MNQECIKYVFKPHSVSGRFCYRISDGTYVFLDEMFPYLCRLGRSYDNHRACMLIEKIHFKYGSSSGVAWIDKYGNAIVRYVNPYKQTKINF